MPKLDETVKGVILSGSEIAVNDKNAPKPDLSAILAHFPILGIGYGALYMAQLLGASIETNTSKGYNKENLKYFNKENLLFTKIEDNTELWMPFGDKITKLPNAFEIVASSTNNEIAAYYLPSKNIYGLQFHPEVNITTQGTQIIKNFVVDICSCAQNWSPSAFVKSSIKSLKARLTNDKVILGLSGGVDSSVAAILLNRAIGKNLTCIFVDTGLLRKNEYYHVLESYKDMGLNVIGIDAKDIFLNALKGVRDPEEKRKIIGHLFIEVFDSEAKKLPNVKWLAQGTIYPDVIESVSVSGSSLTIKSHHNVGGLPEKMHLKVIEPLRLLFKDEVRKVGHELDLSPTILNRHPFPGPGLAIRILGEVSHEKVAILQEVDHIFIEGLKSADLYDKVWQAGAILLPVRSVGITGHERTYENVVALRAVQSVDGMTAECVNLPFDFLTSISNEIIKKVSGVNRVVYDISSKPPATIEWE